MTSNNHSAEEIRAVLDGALAAAGLADEDVAKAMLVQKAMTATGVTPEVMAQESDLFVSIGAIHIRRVQDEPLHLMFQNSHNLPRLPY